MPCMRFSTPSGSGFVCSRGPQPRRLCVVCLREGKRTPAPVLCDWPNDALTRNPAPKTCDKSLCRAHAVAVGPGIDHCPDHKETR